MISPKFAVCLLGIAFGIVIVAFLWDGSVVVPSAVAGDERMKGGAESQPTIPSVVPPSLEDLPATLREHVSREPNEIAPGWIRASELPDAAKNLFDRVNRCLLRKGDPAIPSDHIISENDVKALVDIVTADNKAINDADKVILEMQNARVPDMVRTIKESIAAGKVPPYEDITGKGIPRSGGPYDRYVTSSYQGTAYLLTLPLTSDLMDRVNHLRTVEALRLSNIRFIIKPLFRERE